MQSQTKTIPVHNEANQRGDSRFWVNVRRAKISETQQIMRANQSIPFYRGHVPARGIQSSPLND